MKTALRISMRLALVVLAVAFSACSVVSQEGIQSVSMAPGDDRCVFSYRRGDDSLIATRNLNEPVSSIVVKSDDGTIYERPVFSNDGQKLYFIARKKPDRSDLFSIAIDGSDMTQITHGQEGAQNIQDLALSHDGNTIYYINSGYFGHSSPIAKSRPHRMDFFSVRTDGEELERLSYGNVYVLHGLSVSPSGNEIYSRSKILHLNKPRYFTDFDPSPFIVFTSTYPVSEFTDDGKFVLASAKVEERKPGFSSRGALNLGEYSAVYGFGLFLIDTNSETVQEIIHLHSYLDSPALSHERKRILFVRNDTVYGGQAGRELWSVNLDGSNLQRIELRIEK